MQKAVYLSAFILLCTAINTQNAVGQPTNEAPNRVPPIVQQPPIAGPPTGEAPNQVPPDVQQPPTDDPLPEKPIPGRFLNLTDELRRVNLNNLRDFALYGNAELKRDYEQADGSDRPDVVARIRAEQANIATKPFVVNYDYSVSSNDVNISGNKSAFRSTIPLAGFEWVERIGTVGGTINIASFPVSNVMGRASRLASVRFIHSLGLNIAGNTDSIRELVRNSDNYQVKVWFRIQYYVPHLQPPPLIEDIAAWRATATRVGEGEPWEEGRRTFVPPSAADIVAQRAEARGVLVPAPPGGWGYWHKGMELVGEVPLPVRRRAEQHRNVVLSDDVRGIEIIRVDIVGKSGEEKAR